MILIYEITSFFYIILYFYLFFILGPSPNIYKKDIKIWNISCILLRFLGVMGDSGPARGVLLLPTEATPTSGPALHTEVAAGSPVALRSSRPVQVQVT